MLIIYAILLLIAIYLIVSFSMAVYLWKNTKVPGVIGKDELILLFNVSRSVMGMEKGSWATVAYKLSGEKSVSTYLSAVQQGNLMGHRSQVLERYLLETFDHLIIRTYPEICQTIGSDATINLARIALINWCDSSLGAEPVDQPEVADYLAKELPKCIHPSDMDEDIYADLEAARQHLLDVYLLRCNCGDVHCRITNPNKYHLMQAILRVLPAQNLECVSTQCDEPIPLDVSIGIEISKVGGGKLSGSTVCKSPANSSVVYNQIMRHVESMLGDTADHSVEITLVGCGKEKVAYTQEDTT